MLRKIISLLCLSIFLAGPASARKVIHNHHKLMNQSIDLEIRVIRGIKVYYPKNQEHRLAHIEKTLGDLKIILPVSKDSCRDIELNIFFLPDNILNNREIMHFMSWDNWDNKDVWGAYDAFHNPKIGEMMINITASDTRISNTIGHEWYHHHQTASCKKRSEDGVDNFERRFCEISSTC